PVGEDRAHAPVVARPAQDAADHRGGAGEDGGLRRHGAGAEGDGVREGALEAGRDVRRVADAKRRHLDPEDRHRRAAQARVPALPRARGRRGRPREGGPRRRDGGPGARASDGVPRRMSDEIAPTAIVYPGTVLGEGCQVLDYAVVGKQPSLSSRPAWRRRTTTSWAGPSVGESWSRDRRSAAARASAARLSCAPGSRSGKKRSSARARSSCGMCPREPWWSAIPPARSAKSPTR